MARGLVGSVLIALTGPEVSSNQVTRKPSTITVKLRREQFSVTTVALPIRLLLFAGGVRLLSFMTHTAELASKISFYQ